MSQQVPHHDSDGEFKAILNLIKKILKERGVSYSQLATQMGLSESGLKKILSSDDASYGRISQIVTSLGLRMVDLMMELEKSEARPVAFNDDEQAYFLKNPEAFHFFVRLVIERKSADDIQNEFKMKAAVVFKYLNKLDEFGWIKLGPGNKVKLLPLSLVEDFGSGPLLDKVYQEWGKQAVEDLAKPENQKSGKFIIRCLRMKETTYQDFLVRLKEMELDLLRTGIREMSISNKNLKTMRWVSLTDQTSFVK